MYQRKNCFLGGEVVRCPQVKKKREVKKTQRNLNLTSIFFVSFWLCICINAKINLYKKKSNFTIIIGICITIIISGCCYVCSLSSCCSSSCIIATPGSRKSRTSWLVIGLETRHGPWSNMTICRWTTIITHTWC